MKKLATISIFAILTVMVVAMVAAPAIQSVSAQQFDNVQKCNKKCQNKVGQSNVNGDNENHGGINF
jgi:hypothetical protein